MELNELVEIWQSTDTQLDDNLKINKKLLKEVSISKIKSYLVEFKLGNIIEIIVNSVFVIFLMSFIVDHFLFFEFSIPAVALYIIVAGSLGLNIYKMVLYYKINAESSVIQTQKNIERLKFFDILNKNSLYIIIPIFSTTFLIVMAKALLNYDLYQLGNWLIMFTAGSFVVALIVVFLLKKFPDKNLQKAAAFLKEIREMEHDK